MKLNNVAYEIHTVESFKAANASPCLFDAITASEVIEHVENPEYFIKTCSELLKV